MGPDLRPPLPAVRRPRERELGMNFGAQLLQYLLSGLTVGAIYALMAVGFVVTFNVTGVLNFAQGEFAMVGALLALSVTRAGVPVYLAVPVAIAGTVVVGALVERLAIYPARRWGPLTLVIITIGVSIAMRGIGLLIWGTESYVPPALIPGDPIRFLGASLQRQAGLAIVLSLVLVWLLHLFFNRTVLGTAVRAVVMNQLAARLMGISPERASVLAFAISAGFGAVAGVILAPIAAATYDMGTMLTLKAFVAAMLGGLTNAPASILGGMVLGLTESFGAGLISSAFKDAIAFLLLLAMLFVRPTGLLGKASGKRV